MAGQTLITADAVLKDDYKDLRDSINNKVGVLTQIEKNTEDIQGRKAVHTVHVNRSSGVGARGPGGALPTPGRQGYQQVNVPTRYNYGVIKIDRTLIKALKSDKGGFIRAVDSETRGIERDATRDVARQSWGTGDGIIAACGTTSNSTTLQLAATTTRSQMRHLWNDGGMVIDIGTTADPDSVASDLTVTAVDYDNLTVTVSTAVTTTSSHRVCRAGAGGASTNTGNPGDGQIELTGLQKIVSNTGILHTVDPSSVEKWKSTVKTAASNRHPSETLINDAIQDTQFESGEFVGLLVANKGVVNNIANDMTAMRRNNDKVALKAGYSGIAWDVLAEGGAMGERALMIDKDCPENELYGLSLDNLVEYVESDWDWADDDGSILKWDNGYDAYIAYYAKYHELAAKLRDCHFVIEKLSEAST